MRKSDQVAESSGKYDKVGTSMRKLDNMLPSNHY